MKHQLPQYLHSRWVGAATITRINKHGDGSAMLFLDNGTQLHVFDTYVNRYKPKAGGVYVELGSGRPSYATADEFASDYVVIESEAPRKPAAPKKKKAKKPASKKPKTKK